MLPAAAAIELIHTYSLIHDDLPAMDDDELRRGRPTSHVVYGEDVAILAGDGLFAEAIRLFCERQARRAGARARRAGRAGRGDRRRRHGRRPVPRRDRRRRPRRRRPARAARAEDRPPDRRQRARAADPGRVGRSRDEPYRRFADELGVLFQIVDDILDVTGSDEELGKPQGSDERHGKLTYVSLFGLERARELAAESHAKARAALAEADGETADLELITDFIHTRQALTGPRTARSGAATIPASRPMDRRRTTARAACSTRSPAPPTSAARSDEELAQIAQEVRELIIDTIGEIGGHFGANLGTCELTTVLHSLLDSPRDKILWDVGHQAYPHKVLTGRADRLETIRQYEGLAPFCSMFESEHDIMGAGHASTSIGYAVGLKEAMRHGIGEDGKVVAVIGDGALTGGVAFEALHNAGGLQTPIVIVLNDNGMSISPNVGALSRSFQRLRANPRLYHAREDVEARLTKLPLGLGRQIERLGPEIKSAIKAYAAPGLFFEELDLAYMGPIDGHDVTALRANLEAALEADRPVVVHIHTVKGKGFEPAEEGGLEGMEKWHAAKPGSIVEGKPAPKKPAAEAAADPRRDGRGRAPRARPRSRRRRTRRCSATRSWSRPSATRG